MVICLIFTSMECVSREIKRILLPSLSKKKSKPIRKREITVTLQSKGITGSHCTNVVDNGTLLVEKEENRIGLLAILTYSLLFYLVVFHSLANLPLKTPLMFGVHQVSAILQRCSIYFVLTH